MASLRGRQSDGASVAADQGIIAAALAACGYVLKQKLLELNGCCERLKIIELTRSDRN